MAIVAFFDTSFLSTLPGRTVEPAAMDRHGTVRAAVRRRAEALCARDMRVRTTPKKATLELCDRLSNPLIEVDAVVYKDCPDVVCGLGYGIASGAVIDKGALPDYHVLWPGKPTTNTVEDYTWFEAFSEEGRGLHTRAAYAKQTKDERSDR